MWCVKKININFKKIIILYICRYTYTVDGKQEGFSRTLAAGQLTTHNELFGRKETISPLKGMGYPKDKPQWNRSIGPTELFDESYIPTVIFDEGSRDFFITGNDTWTLGRFTIIIKDEIFTEEQVPTKAQNRYQDKFQFRIKLVIRSTREEFLSLELILLIHVSIVNPSTVIW